MISLDRAPSLTPPGRTSGRVWVHSDLQLDRPDQARQVLARTVDDVLAIGEHIDAVWCLGDALLGNREERLEEVAEVCIEQLGRVQAPICYLMGNHEMDLRGFDPWLNRYALYERATRHPQWHTMPAMSDFYFARRMLGTLVVFMGDHAARDKSWWTSHGRVQGGAGRYPHGPEAYAELRDAIAAYNGPAVIASHYAFPGGQRHSELMRRMLPLPANVRTHLFGHAHIGDVVYNKDDPWRREHPVTGQPLRQFNISALENDRSPGIHSAFLDFGPDGPATLHIRCHDEQRWLDTFELSSPAR